MTNEENHDSGTPLLSESDIESNGVKDPKRRSKKLTEWVVIIVVAVLVSFVMRSYVLQTFFIPSASMEPTLQIGDRIVVSKLSTEFGTIHRGDIVVFKAPPSEHCGEVVADLVKRVIGLPGDHLTSNGNRVLYEPAGSHTFSVLKEDWTHVEPLGGAIGNVVVPANSYFMMGDNRPNSCDSRMWGSVPKSYLIGKVFLRIWPMTRVGLL